MSLVYSYGAKPPVEGEQIVRDQLWLGHRYQNDLVEVARARHVVVRQAVLVGKSEGKSEEEIKAVIEEIHDRVLEYKRALRASYVARGLFWGSYLLIEQSKDAALSAKGEPHFKSWDYTGRIGVQIQGSRTLTIAGALACTDSRLRIERLPDSGNVVPGSGRSGRRAKVYLRVGSDGLKPIWAAWPVTLHRLPPEDTQITGVTMHRKRIGPDFRWFLSLTLRLPEIREDPATDSNRTGTVAIDLGWRVRKHGVRVGYWRNDSGEHGELIVPDSRNPRRPSLRMRWQHADELHGVRERQFNEFRTRLLAWTAGREGLPDWLAEARRYMPLWKSPKRMVHLAWVWQRFAGDEDIYPEVLAWRKQDRHLYGWEGHERCGTIDARKALYQAWAVDFARRYRRVVIEKFRLPEVAGRRKLKKNATDAEKKKADRASAVRHMIAPGEFRTLLRQACGKRGTEVVELPAAWTTIDCAACGVRLPWDPAPQVEHQCDACGTVVDQDDQACRNLLHDASGYVAPETREVLEPEMSKRQQAFRKGKERKRLREASKISVPLANQTEAT